MLSARGATGRVHRAPVSNRPDTGPRADAVRVRPRDAQRLHHHAAPERAARLVDGRLARQLGRRHARRRRQQLQRGDLVRSRRQLPQRRAARRGALHAGRSRPNHLHGDDRGPEGLHAPVDHQPRLLPPHRAELPAARLRVLRLRAGRCADRPDQLISPQIAQEVSMRVLQSILGSALILVAITGTAYGQAGTFNGRVLDKGAAVLPGVTVTATNVSTGVSRTAVTNAEGLYYMPGLDPGVYEVKTDLAGFAPAARERVTLGVNATLTLDFKMRVASLNETVTVTGDAPIIEVTQSKVASTIQANQLENLPMITRSVSGMLSLLPGAAAMAPTHRSKENVGSVSIGGASGTNVMPTVDGADNRDNRYGGPLLTFTTEALEQFQLATSQFTAADGRTGGAALTMVTKSGTNAYHGSAFLFARDKSMTAKDYFTRTANPPQEKAPFNRKQFGGAIGGGGHPHPLVFFWAGGQGGGTTAGPGPRPPSIPPPLAGAPRPAPPPPPP